MKQISKFMSLLLVFTFLLIGLYAQQNKKGLTNELSGYKVLVNDKKETFEKIDKIKSNDIIEYRLTLTNNSKNKIKDLKPVIPIPDGTFFLADSANPTKIYVSLNEKSFSLAPLYIDKKLVDPALYKFIKWDVKSLDAGEKTVLKIRVKVK